jgi:hypothetical protein
MTRQSQLKAHNCLAIPSLLHGFEIQALEQKVKRRQKTAEMNFTRRDTQQETVYYTTAKKMTHYNKLNQTQLKIH